MNPLLAEEIWKRAGNRCEYCRIPHPRYRVPFQIDHIIARQHGGPTAIENLALACLHCNRFKGPKSRGSIRSRANWFACSTRGPTSGRRIFQFEGARISGTTAIGRATVQVLAMNASDLLRVRFELIAEGISLL